MEPLPTIADVSEIELGLDSGFNYVLFQRKDKKASPRDFSTILGFLKQVKGISGHAYYRLEGGDDVVMLEQNYQYDLVTVNRLLEKYVENQVTMSAKEEAVYTDT